MGFRLFTRTRHDTSYSLIVQFTDRHGPVDLTSATQIVFTMVNRDTGVVKINRQPMTKLNQVTNLGQAQYNWTVADVDTSAYYNCEGEATFADGTKATWPSDEYAELFIKPDLDNT